MTRGSRGRGENAAERELTARPPILSVVQLSDSFSSLWPVLAAEEGLPLHVVPGVAELGDPSESISLLAAGGEEARLEDLLRANFELDLELAVAASLANHRVAVTAVQAGAAEYFALPGDLSLLRSWIGERAARHRARVSAEDFTAGERTKYAFAGILGDSPALQAALNLAARVIPHGAVTILITGETGTGKELLARAIHYNGPRGNAPFIDINCAAIPDQLLESELFGHEKGAFTDASTSKPGLFEMAQGGTLFLDEIGHLALPLQGKLLRALEERSIRRVGGTRAIPMDVRIIAATHVDLAAASRRGDFREDLYYRLNVVPLELPALRERRSDIVPLATHFITRFAGEYDLTPPTLAPAAEQLLRLHHWNGNIRELRNAIERAVLLCHRSRIVPADLALDTAAPRPRRAGSLPFPSTLSALTRVAAEEMLHLCDGNKSESARQLGISRPRLLRILDDSKDPTALPHTGVDDD